MSRCPLYCSEFEEKQELAKKSKPAIGPFSGKRYLRSECTAVNVCRCGDRLDPSDTMSVDKHAKWCPRLMMKCFGCGVGVVCWSYQQHVFQCQSVPDPTYFITTNGDACAEDQEYVSDVGAENQEYAGGSNGKDNDNVSGSNGKDNDNVSGTFGYVCCI